MNNELSTVREEFDHDECDHDECDHGLYSGGPTHGQPYAMCERKVGTDSIVTATIERIIAERVAQARAEAHDAALIDYAIAIERYQPDDAPTTWGSVATDVREWVAIGDGTPLFRPAAPSEEADRG